MEAVNRGAREASGRSVGCNIALPHEQSPNFYLDRSVTCQYFFRYEADLVDQLFNSSEKRLARVLLLLSRYAKDSPSDAVVEGVNQEQLAQMVGTTRSRVNLFMNRFRKRGFIDYHGVDGVIVHRSLLNVLTQTDVAPRRSVVRTVQEPIQHTQKGNGVQTYTS